MANSAAYDYSVTLHNLRLFENPLGDESIFVEMVDTYGDLFEFKDEIPMWTFGVSRFKNFVYMRYRVEGSTVYLNWNMNEKVAIIECHKDRFVVITLRAVDDNGNEKDHSHSIVLDYEKRYSRFDLDNLMTFLEGSETFSPLNIQFREAGYTPWQEGSAAQTAQRLSRIFQTLDRYAIKNVQKQPNIARSGGHAQRSGSNPRREPSEGPVGSGSRGPRPSQPGSGAKKRNTPATEETGSTRKRRKSNPAGGSAIPASGGSSGSGLTSVAAGPSTSLEKVPNYVETARIQKEFWANHEDCFLLKMATKKVNIDQCILAKDQYVIRTLQRNMIEDVKMELVQMIDVNQRQKVCLTPVDEKERLLKTEPQTWEEIMDGKFMIINGQHSIFASKELQNGGCDKERAEKLRTWDAYIVWSLDPAKLRAISKFYNITNHLDHAQPTWGNQIISCRNIWTDLKRPTDCRSEASTRGNKAVFSLERYKVYPKP